MFADRIPPWVRATCQALEFHKHQAFIVGGACRDLLMGVTPHDWDIATDATPDQVCRVFPLTHRVTTGIKHGTVLVVPEDQTEPIEITTFRTEHGFSDGRHPDRVEFSTSILEDLSRRDFTVNAMALDPLDPLCQLVDPFGGQRDLDDCLIRAVGEPTVRFEEDALRLLRACRFASQLDFAVESNTWAALVMQVPRLRQVSVERVQTELLKLLQGLSPDWGLDLLRQSGILHLLLPEFVPMVNMAQNRWHQHTVWGHTLAVVEHAPVHLRLAALFHDLGKTVTQAPKKDCPGEFSFFGHDEIGAELTRRVLTRLKFSNEQIDQTCHLVRHHMVTKLAKHIKPAGIRRAIQRIGKDRLDDLFALSRADIRGMAGSRVEQCLTEEALLRERFQTELKRPVVVQSPRDVRLNGHDLMAALDLTPGPWVGQFLRQLTEHVLDHPEDNTRETLIMVAQRWKANGLIVRGEERADDPSRETDRESPDPLAAGSSNPGDLA